jgi:hypothetical protein
LSVIHGNLTTSQCKRNKNCLSLQSCELGVI